VALVRTDVSEEPSASFIRVTRIDELGTTLAATSIRRTLRRNTKKTPFFIVTALKTSNITNEISSRRAFHEPKPQISENIFYGPE
jgi:hypothetical protein